MEEVYKPALARRMTLCAVRNLPTVGQTLMSTLTNYSTQSGQSGETSPVFAGFSVSSLDRTSTEAVTGVLESAPCGVGDGQSKLKLTNHSSVKQP